MTDQPDLPPELLERLCCEMCAEGGLDPFEVMPNDGPRWRYYEPSVRAVAPMLIAHGRELENAEVVAWLHEDADQTEQEAEHIVANTTGNPRKNAAEWALLVSLKRGIADAIDRKEHRSKPCR